MYVLFGAIRANARLHGTWRLRYDVAMVLFWAGGAVGHYHIHHEWSLAFRAIGVAGLSIAAGHIIFLLLRKSAQGNM
jgi:hypothetical protein